MLLSSSKMYIVQYSTIRVHYLVLSQTISTYIFLFHSFQITEEEMFNLIFIQLFFECTIFQRIKRKNNAIRKENYHKQRI